MALHPENIVNGATNITGVDMVIPPEKQMTALKIIPSVQSVGLYTTPPKPACCGRKPNPPP